MKKLKIFLLTVCGVFLMHTANAQNIVGVGNLRMGMTEAEFLELPEISSKLVRDAEDKNYKQDDRAVWKKTNESKVASYEKIYSPDYVVYEFDMAIGIKDYAGNDNYKVSAKFVKRKLIHIQVFLTGGYDVEKLLSEKYGQPNVLDKMKKVVCQNGYGAKSVHSDGFIAFEWGAKTKNNASLLIGSSDCGKLITSSYSVEDGKKYSQILEAERRIEKNIEKEELKNKANASKL